MKDTSAETCPPLEILQRDHTWQACAFMACSLSMCITVDILQYSMPLAFLPSVLEDRGHSPMKIATAVGVYYWTGFAGGLIITSHKVYKLLTSTENRTADGAVTLPVARRQLMYLVISLTVASATLIVQAMHPCCFTHTMCRLVQGFAGSFIFFYTFMLSVSLFQGQQQVFAMTAASAALNVAEVLGGSLGAVLFDSYGQRAVFWFLGAVSVLNQLLLIAVLFMLRASGETLDASKTLAQPEQTPRPGAGWSRLNAVLQSRRLACAVILIVMGAVVKGSVEEMLPFHADHEWGLEPIQIGKLFSVIAFAYIGAAGLCGQLWCRLHHARVPFCASWLAILGASAWFVFYTASISKSQNMLWLGLGAYGICLGLTHTPAALLLADAIEEEEGEAKDAVNGIWNTMWEAGGSLGFLLGGLLAEDYRGQVDLMTAYAGCCVLCAMLMIVVARRPERTLEHKAEDKLGYGSAMAK